MIIIKIMGGLGNQMFQVALGQKLISIGKKVKYDRTYYDVFNENDTSREYMLDIFSNLKMAFADNLEINEYSNYDSITNRISKKVFKRNISHVIYEKNGIYMQDIYKYDDKYLIGYWQNEKYFNDIAEQITNIFTFDRYSNIIDKSLMNDIENNLESVSVHIRGTDYLEQSDIFGGVCTDQYYQRAVEVLLDMKKECFFYVFSDDIEYARNVLKEIADDRFKFVKGNVGKDSWTDMYYMSLCKHHIIANSSYSWWGAWLGQKYTDGMIICPQKWNNYSNSNDVCSRKWVRIAG